MAIVKHNNGTNFSGVSVVEASYIVNAYIEESFNDLQIKCLMVDNRSLQESGIRYFTEENEVGKKKLGAKVKEIFENVWNGIVGIFNKIKEFFSNLITNIKVKSANPKNKDIVKNAADNDIYEIVKDKVSVYYDLNKYGKALDKLVSRTSGDKFDGEYDLFHTYMGDAKLEGDNINITKDDLLNSAFGGFRNQYKDVQNKFKSVEKAFKTIKDKTDSATKGVGFEDGEEAVAFKTVKDALKMVNAYSAGYSKMIIHNAKMLVKVVDELVKKSKKTQATGESVSWDFVF
jgi:hypothetical protein